MVIACAGCIQQFMPLNGVTETYWVKGVPWHPLCFIEKKVGDELGTNVQDLTHVPRPRRLGNNRKPVK